MTVVTRWWWIRHAPVAGDDPGRISGQLDIACDISDAAALTALARRLPKDAVWVTSPLARARDSAKALGCPPCLTEEGLAEQHLGAWQGLTWDEVYRVHGAANEDFWKDPGLHRPPGGESFAEVVARVDAVVRRLTADHAGRDIVAVAHGGSIRAAIAAALELEPRRALAIGIDTLSLTRLDHVDGPPRHQLRGVWRIGGINLPPR